MAVDAFGTRFSTRSFGSFAATASPEMIRSEDART
jgi:hypothetical protein